MNDNGGLSEEVRGIVSRVMCGLVQEIVAWTEIHSVTLSARDIPEKKNILADQ